MPKSRFHLALGLMVAAACVPVAVAQSAFQRQGSRPSQFSASARVGRVGGIYTRGEDTLEAFTFPKTTATPATADGRMSLLGLSASRISSILERPSQSSAQSLTLYPRSRIVYLGEIGPVELEAITRYNLPMQKSAPLGGWVNPDLLPPLATPVYATDEPPTKFHAFFGLKPALPPRNDAAVQAPPLHEAIEDDTVEHLRRVEQRAERAFKEGMTAGGENRYDELQRALGLFRAVRRLDPDAYLPSLLSFHAALETNRAELAVRNLMDAIRRHPQLFAERLDLSPHFGDARVLEAQMRRHVALPNVEAVPSWTYMVQAYCAWRIDDRARTRVALGKLRETLTDLQLDPGERREIETFSAALEFALQ